MNHIYRSVWNKALEAMVAVAEVVSRRSSGAASSAFSSQVDLPFEPASCGPFANAGPSAAIVAAVGVVCGGLLSPALAQTLPQGGVAIHGSAVLSNPAANKLVVTTQNGAGTSYSAINWNSFSIGNGATTQFVQPSAASLSINRVVTNTPSQLFGTLSSNGQIVLVNQSGIAVGTGAVVDTAGFTASAVGMTQADAMAGRLRFAGDGLGNTTGALRVEGNIIARGGDVVLIAPSIDLAKTAVVESQGGSVSLAAGQSVEITGRGLEGITLQVQAPTDKAINLGTLKGNAVGIFAGTLRHSGLIQAVTAGMDGGKVVLRATGDAYVQGAGKVLATGDVAGAQGGSVDVLGGRVAIADQALIDVSGQAGGGGIRVGGDFQGKNPDVPNAQVSYLGPDAALKADAVDSGGGGRVIVWADDTARVYGHISVRGGANGGDGGFVETSGHKHLTATRAPDLAAPKGKGGLWLLDPNDINIISGELDLNIQTSVSEIGGITKSPFFESADNSASILTAATLNAALASGSVTVSTSSANGGSGDINFDPVNGPIDISNPTGVARDLLLNADGVIRFKPGGTTAFYSPALGSSLTVQLNANQGVITDVGASVRLNGLLDGSGSGQVTARLPSGSTWNNNDVLFIDGNANVHLDDQSGASTFNNNFGGIVEASSTSGWAFTSSPGTQSSIISNHGDFRVNTGTALEAKFEQSATGILRVKDAYLNLQNAGTISGTIDLLPTAFGASSPGTINVNEYHGNTAHFNNTAIVGAGGSLNVDGSFVSAKFTSVNAPSTTVSVGAEISGTADFGPGNTVFNGLSVGGNGTVNSMDNTHLGITGGNFIVPSIASYSGSVGFYATGGITLPLSSSVANVGGDVTMMASWDGTSALGAGALQAEGTGGISLFGGVSTFTGAVKLYAKGAISQDSEITGAAINTADLGAVTGGNIALNLGNNVSGNLGLTSTAGAITFNNTAGSFNLSGANAAGNLAITTTGAMALAGPVTGALVNMSASGPITNAGGVVDTSAANGSITLSASSIGASGDTVALNPGTGAVSLTATNGHIYANQSMGAMDLSRYAVSAAGVGSSIHLFGSTVNGDGVTIPALGFAGFSANTNDDDIAVIALADNATVSISGASKTARQLLLGVTGSGSSVTLGANNFATATVLDVFSLDGDVNLNGLVQSNSPLTRLTAGGSVLGPGSLRTASSNADGGAVEIVANASQSGIYGSFVPSGNGGINVTGFINTSGASGSDSPTLSEAAGKNGGDVWLQVDGGSGTLHIPTIHAMGGAGAVLSGTGEGAAGGGHGGAVFISGPNVVASGVDVFTTGGSGGNGAVGGPGGDGGAIFMEATNAISMTATTLTASGGAGGTGSVVAGGSAGVGGDVVLEAPGVVVTGVNFQTNGGAGGDGVSPGVTGGAGGGAGQIFLHATGGNLDVDGVFLAIGGNGGNALLDGTPATGGAAGWASQMVFGASNNLAFKGPTTIDNSSGFPGSDNTGASGAGNFLQTVYLLADTGSISQSGGSTVTAPGAIVSLYAPSGNVDLQDSANLFGQMDGIAGGNLRIAGIESVGDAGMTAGGNLSLTGIAGSTLPVFGALAASSIDLRADAIVMFADVNAANTLSLTSTGARGTGVSQSDGVISAGGLATVNAGGGAQDANLTGSLNALHAVAVTAQSATIANDLALVLSDTSVANSLTVLTNNANVTQAAGATLNVGGFLGFDTGTGHVTLTNSGNAINSLGVISAGAVDVVATGDVMLSGINTESLNLNATGNIGTYMDVAASSGGISITSSGGSINLAVDGSATLVAAGPILLNAASSLDVTFVTFQTPGNLTLAAGSGGLLSATGADIQGVSGSWLTYLTNPAAAHAFGPFDPMASATFRQLNAPWGTTSAASGNGSLWSDSGVRSAMLTGTVSKTYDGTTAIDLGPAFQSSSLALSAPGFLFGETTADLSTATGTLASPNAGTGIGVTLGPMALTGVLDGGGKPTYGYTLSASGNVGTVIPAPVSTTINLNGLREYDGTAVVNASIFSLAGLINGETLTLSGAGTVADKNVGVNKPVTLGSLALGNGTGLAGNYTLTGGTHVATITPRTLSTWIGSGSGSWSTPSNWDALPDAANVLNVAIPSGTQVTYDAAAGATQVQSIVSAGKVQVAGGNLQIGDTFRTYQYGQSGGTVTGSGSLVVDNSFSQSLGSISLGGYVDVTQVSGSLLLGAITASAIRLSAPAGGIGQGSGGLTTPLLSADAQYSIMLTGSGNQIGAFAASSTLSGLIKLTSAGPVDIQGISTANGDIVIVNTGGIATSGPVVANGGAVSMTANSPLIVNAGSAILADGNIDLTATNLTSAGNMLIDGPLTSFNGGITLNAASNFVQNSTVLAAQGITVSAGGSIAFGPSAISTGNPVSYTAGGLPVLNPPASLGELLARSTGTGTSGFINDFLDYFEDALESNAGTDSGDGIKSQSELVVEGETCRP